MTTKTKLYTKAEAVFTKEKISAYLMFMGFVIAFVGMVITLIGGLSMVAPLNDEIERAHRDLRVCVVTEGCDESSLEKRLDLLHEKARETRAYWGSIAMNGGITGLGGGILLLLGYWRGED